MGLLDKLFKGKDGRRDGAPASSGLDDDDDDDATSSVLPRVAPRRELVQVVLRETMRKHGIPSDWIESRILSVISESRGTGMHVMLRVRNGDDRLVTYVHAFQASFMQELTHLEPRAGEWLFSLSWQFDNPNAGVHSDMPEPGSWGGAAAAAAGAAAASAPDTHAPEQDDLQEDLKALFAIRDAHIQKSADGHEQRPGFEDTRPGGDTGPGRAD